jgi:hypothetical protein
VFLTLWPSLSRQKAQPAEGENVAADLHAHQVAAKRALAAGQYHLAFQEADAAKKLSERSPAALDRDERLELEQLYRECDTLARLLDVPLQELVDKAQDKDWPAHFKELYQGKTVIFDDVLRADAMGQPALHTYEVRLGDEKVHCAVEDIRLLRSLPLDPPQRALFGARLAKVSREADGWVIRFDPDSGVLFTDADADYGVPLDDDLVGVIQRQQTWWRKHAEGK